MRRIRILVGFALLALAVFTPVSHRNQALANVYSCKLGTPPTNGDCYNASQCTADHYQKNGICAITCYNDHATNQGEIVVVANISCPPASGGRAPGSGPSGL